MFSFTRVEKLRSANIDRRRRSRRDPNRPNSSSCNPVLVVCLRGPMLTWKTLSILPSQRRLRRRLQIYPWNHHLQIIHSQKMKNYKTVDLSQEDQVMLPRNSPSHLPEEPWLRKYPAAPLERKLRLEPHQQRPEQSELPRGVS